MSHRPGNNSSLMLLLFLHIRRGDHKRGPNLGISSNCGYRCCSVLGHVLRSPARGLNGRQGTGSKLLKIEVIVVIEGHNAIFSSIELNSRKAINVNYLGATITSDSRDNK